MEERYQRQIILKGFGEAAQSKLAQAKVLVIGAGGLGCPALQYLAAAGIGTVGIIDDDTIALSNLHRQILYTTADVGKMKSVVAAQRLQEMNPTIVINHYPMRLAQQNVLEIFKGFDYILDGSDNFETRYLVNDASAMLKKPLIFAAVSDFEGQLAIFNVSDKNGNTCNYRDLFPEQPTAGEIPNCAENGVLGILPGIIGTMAAAETIKLITGIGKPLINILLHYNLLTNQQFEMIITSGNKVAIPQTPEEFLTMNYQNTCETNSNYIEINAEQLDQLKQNPSTILIDVRETFESPSLNPSIFTSAPMSAFGDLLQRDIIETNIVLLCQHGIRSVTAAEALHEKYGSSKNIYSLKGGIAKWRNYFAS